MKKHFYSIHCIHIALIALLFSSTGLSPNAKSIQKIASSILRKRSSQTCKAGYKLIDELKNQKSIAVHELDKVVSALEHNRNFPLLNDNQQITTSAIKLLHKTPGFLPTFYLFLVTIPHPHTAKGYLYELEKAVTIVKENQGKPDQDKEIVCQLNQLIRQDYPPYFQRIVDIVTTKRVIECKAGQWQYYKVKKNNQSHCEIGIQLMEQQALVAYHNLTHGTNLKHELHSKQAITKKWKKWLEGNNIIYYEEK